MNKGKRIKAKSEVQGPARPPEQQPAEDRLKIRTSTFRLLIAVTGSIFVAEIFVMILLYILPELPLKAVILLDASLLAVVTFPILYFALFRPLVRHISERQRIEDRFRKANEFNETIIKTIPLGVDILDEEGNILFLNERLEAVLGKEAIGKTCWSAYRDSGEKCEDCPLPQDIEIGQTRSHEVYDMAGGRTCSISYTGMMYQNKKAILRVIEDITERKQREEEVRESEKKYSTLVENSLTGIYIDQDEKIVFSNNRFATIYRYPKEELIDIETWRLVHPEDRALTAEMRALRLKGEDAPLEYEAKGLTKGGDVIWIRRRNRRIEYKGRPAILGNIVDITEQRQAEEELRKMNEELKNFVRIVSHDLKTPITAIQGFSSRLLKQYQDTMEEKDVRYLEQIKASAHRMEVFVADLLALSRIGRVASHFEDVPSLEIVKEVVSNLQDRLERNRIELAIAHNLPTTYCDSERVYQVFQNLLVNAIKYMGDTAHPKIKIGYEEGKEFHQFYVSDNGAGIDSKDHRKIFEMFQRVETIRKLGDEEGTGLGLTIVDRVVRNHGGEVWVESEKGKGATFYFTLSKSLDRVTHP
ncbi:MAG: PAS domain S-box protein [Deltaproteobacteria bacterium]|nr:PAS domain S-box protein [Deltaproteobacteria bacterium]